MVFGWGLGFIHGKKNWWTLLALDHGERDLLSV